MRSITLQSFGAMSLCPRVQASACGHRLTGCRARLHVGQRSTAAASSIKQFIAAGCPVAGFDGRYRERQRDTDVEASIIRFDADSLLTPGCQSLLRASEQTLEQVIKDQGQVLLCVLRPPEPGQGDVLVPLQPPKGGSYSSLAQCYGMQRLPGGQGGYLRVVAQQRVVVQAVRKDSLDGDRAQAAVLRDRWAYYTRAQAVEDALQSAIASCSGGVTSQETLDLSKQPAEIRAAVASMQDVAQQVQGIMMELRERLAAARPWPPGMDGEAADPDELLDELRRMGEFVQGPTPAPAGDVLPFDALERLSFAVYSAGLLAAYSGVSKEELMQQRRKALEVCDLGLRLEAALDFTSDVLARLDAQIS